MNRTTQQRRVTHSTRATRLANRKTRKLVSPYQSKKGC